MKNTFFIILTIVCWLNANGQEREMRIDKQLTQCLDSTGNQTTAGMCNCTYRALKQWDDKLNSTYKALLRRLDVAGKARLAEAQREWIKYRDKDIAAIDAVYNKADGTMWRLVRADKVMELTRKRALELQDIIKDVEGF